MIRSKLSDLEKQEIVSSFEQQKDTILGLAERYQVSSSTIRRLLKQGSPEPSVGRLPSPVDSADPLGASPVESTPLPSTAPPIKGFGKTPKPIPRSARPPELTPVAGLDLSAAAAAEPTVAPQPSSLSAAPENAPPSKRVSRRQEVVPEQAMPDPSPFEGAAAGEKPIRITEATPPQEEISAILEDLGSPISPFTNAAEQEDDEDEDEDDFEDLYDADEEEFGDLPLGESSLQLQPEALLEVLPLAEAILPKTCYLVIDRTSELVTRPLKDFGDLGQIPEDEIQSCTLPVFDNGHVARRFSHRTQRVIKVPNGNMLRAACTQLSAKGITRLLINGRIYAL